MNRKTDAKDEDFSEVRKLDWLKYVTPVLVTIAIFMVNGIQEEVKGVKNDVRETNAMVFKHLTNDEMHCPRSITVTKPEFLIYQNMRDKQMEDIRSGTLRIESLIERHMEKTDKA